MAEISGLKCTDCGRKIFVEDEESPRWATAVMTIPATNYQKTLHYCPDCQAPHLKRAHDSEEKLTTGQQKVINPAHVDPALEAMFQQDPTHAEDSRRSGVPLADWPSPPQGVPAVTGPVALTAGDTEGVPVFPWPGTAAPAGAPRGGPPPRSRGKGKGAVRRKATQAAANMAGGRIASFLTLTLAVAGSVLIQH